MTANHFSDVDTSLASWTPQYLTNQVLQQNATTDASALTQTTADARYGKLAGTNTWTGSQNFTGATVTGAGTWSWQFQPENYGALRDGVHDDTTAVQAAWAAATAYALNNQGYAELLLSPGRYRLATANFIKSASSAGNSLLPMPIVAGTALKPTLVIKGTQEASALPHWNQTVAQTAGAVLDASPITGQTVDGTYGLPSVIGAPTPQQGYGTAGNFNNVLIRVDGVIIMAALNPTIAAMDFRGNGEASIGTVAALVNSTPATQLTTAPTSSWSTGLFMPNLLNNALATIESFTCEGYYFGASLGPHTTAQRLFIAYCGYGIYVPSTGSDKHGVTVMRADVEECNTGLTTDATAGPNTPVFMVLDTEGMDTYHSALGQGYHISDNSNALGGQIWLNDSAGNQSTYKVLGGANLEIIAQNQPRGAVTAPGVPATTVALQNPFWRHAAVRVSGGTVSAITVDGQATGATSGLFDVPSGKSITLTYTVAPTWTWMLR